MADRDQAGIGYKGLQKWEQGLMFVTQNKWEPVNRRQRQSKGITETISWSMFSGETLTMWDCLCQDQRKRVADIDIWWNFRQALYLWSQDRKCDSEVSNRTWGSGAVRSVTHSWVTDRVWPQKEDSGKALGKRSSGGEVLSYCGIVLWDLEWRPEM